MAIDSGDMERTAALLRRLQGESYRDFPPPREFTEFPEPQASGPEPFRMPPIEIPAPPNVNVGRKWFGEYESVDNSFGVRPGDFAAPLSEMELQLPAPQRGASSPQPKADGSLVLPGAPDTPRDFSIASQVAADVHAATADRARRAATPPVNRRAMQDMATRLRTNQRVRAAIPEQEPEQAPESGTLPGEEQVTTRDVLRQLSPAEQAALQKRYETSGHTQTMSYDDFLSTHFGDLPPTERAAAMKSVATTAPRVNIGKDPMHRPGTNTELARSRVDAGKPLPEGRQPKQYTPEQRRVMSRNVFHPEVPMSRFGGTFTQTADGALMARAPNPQALELAAQIAADPQQGAFSDSHIAALAQAYGIDAMQYGDDLDLLRADTMREHERHQRTMRSYDTVRSPMGGYRYKYNPKNAADVRREREAGMTPERRLEFAQRVAARHNNYITNDESKALSQAVNTDDGFTRIRELNNQLNLRRAEYIASRASDRSKNLHLSRDLRNPDQAPGMTIRSLMEAVRENNPLAMAAVYNLSGIPGARDAMQLEMGTRDNATDVVTAEMAAQNNQEAARPNQSEIISDTMRSALANEDATQRYQAVRNVIAQLPANAGLAATKEGQQQIEEQTQDALAGHYASIGGYDHLVQAHLASIRNQPQRFKDFVIRYYRYSPPQAEEYYNQFNKQPTMRDRGRQAAETVGSGAAGLYNLGAGVMDAVFGRDSK